MANLTYKETWRDNFLFYILNNKKRNFLLSTKKFGLKFIFTDLRDLSNVESLITDKTKLIWADTPTNPMINVIDIKGLSDICKSNNILLGVDKTGCNGHSYKLDFAKKNEVENLEYVEQNNIKVFIDPKATIFLIGSEMDYSSDKLASRFVFKNPNEKSTCGCGESFSF